MTTIANMQRRIANINIANGWRDGADPHDTDVLVTRLALVATELSEAIEEVRNGHAVTEMHYPSKPFVDEHGVVANGYAQPPWKPEGVPSELADVAIRLLDTADTLGADLAVDIVADIVDQLPERTFDQPLTFAGVRGFIREQLTEDREKIATNVAPNQAIATLACLHIPITAAILAALKGDSPITWMSNALFNVLLLADAWSIDIEAVIDEKLNYNASRGMRHGGKVA